jgi:hypothetical protein
VTSGLGHFVDDQFTLVWNDPRCRDLTSYLRLDVRIVATGSALQVRYVQLDDGVYAVDPRLTDSLMPNASTDGRVCVGTDDTAWTAQGVPDDDPAWVPIRELYSRKYGEPSAPLLGAVRLLSPATGGTA